MDLKDNFITYNQKLRDVFNLFLENYFELDTPSPYTNSNKLSLSLERVHHYYNQLKKLGYLEKRDNKFRPTTYSIDYYLKKNIPLIEAPIYLIERLKRKNKKGNPLQILKQEVEQTVFFIDYQKVSVAGTCYLLNLNREQQQQVFTVIDSLETNKPLFLEPEIEARQQIRKLFFYYRENNSLKLNDIAFITLKTYLGIFGILGKENILCKSELLKKILAFKASL